MFSALNPIFLSPNNLANMLFDASTAGIIALGIVYMLMLGEIDLPVASVSGLASDMVGLLWVNTGWLVWLAIVASLCVGAIFGMVYAALFNPLGMPTFVSTLAGLLAVLGLQLYILAPTGSINLPCRATLPALARPWSWPRGCRWCLPCCPDWCC